MSGPRCTLLSAHLAAGQRTAYQHRQPVAHAMRQLVRGVAPTAVALVFPVPRAGYPCPPPGCHECRWLAVADTTGVLRLRLAAGATTPPGNPDDCLDVRTAARAFAVPAKRLHRLIARRQLATAAGSIRRGDVAALFDGGVL